MRATAPLFRLDPGWLFVTAGLIVCAAGVLLPAQADLRALESQLTQLHAEEARAYQRLAAHADFIDQVEHSDPAIIKRLAAAQLNLVPEGDTPLLLSSADASPVTDWIDATVKLDIRPVRLAGLSTLSQWTSGPQRLWVFGAGIMAVFMGLLIAPGGVRRRRDQHSIDDGRLTIDSCERARHQSSAMDCRSRGPVNLWIDQDEQAIDVIDDSRLMIDDLAPSGDDRQSTIVNRNDRASVIDLLVPATNDSQEHEVSQIADTVDLEPDELPITLTKRTVIAEIAGPVDLRDRAPIAGLSAMTLQAHKVDANEGGAERSDEIDPANDVIDAPEGSIAGLANGDTRTVVDHLEACYAGTGLLDAAEHHDEMSDGSPAAGLSAMGPPAPPTSSESTRADVEQAASDVVAVAPNAPADLKARAIDADGADDADGTHRKRRGNARRRPRRTRKQRTSSLEETANERRADVESQSAVDAEIDINGAPIADCLAMGTSAAMGLDDQPEADDESADIVIKNHSERDAGVPIAERPAIGPTASAVVEDDDDDAASIPFLRRRRHAQERD